MTVIITANIGDYDTPKNHAEQDIDCTFVTLTDIPKRGSYSRTAKEPKLRPWAWTDLPGPWIWIDASVEIKSPTFASEVLDATDTFGMWCHPHRDCIYDEVQVAKRLRKYRRQGLEAQAEHYRDLGHPEHWGLWAAGIIVYREPMDDLADRWMAEIDAWTLQDQVSLPVVLRDMGVTPSPLPYTQYDNPLIHIYPHARARR